MPELSGVRGKKDNLHLTISGKELAVKRFSCVFFEVMKVTE